MNLGMNEIARVGSFVIGGGLVAGGYKMLEVYNDQRQSRPLRVETDAIQKNELLYSLFSEIDEKVADVDPVAFIQAVDATDRLIFVVNAIESGGVDVPSTDKEEAYQFNSRAKRSIVRLNTSLRNSEMPPDVIVQFKKKFKLIIEELDKYLLIVVRLCRKKENMH